MKTKLLNNKLFAGAGALFCCALWGISTPIVKMGYAYLDANHTPSLFLWVGALFAVAGILTLAIYGITARQFPLPKKGGVKLIALVSLLQTVLQYALAYVALLHTTSVKGSILKSTDVFFVALISSLIFKLEKLTPKKLFACIIGFLGIIVMNLDGLSLNFNLMGDGLLVLGVLCYSFSVVVIRVFATEEDPLVLSGYQMTLGGIILLLAGLALGGTVDFVGMLPIFGVLAAIYAISYSLWTALLKYNPPSSITIFSFMTPVFGVVFSALLLNEEGGVAPLSLGIALVLVCLGIILWGYEKKQK